VDQRSRRQLLERLHLTVDRPIVAFCPGAEYGPAKRWPARHFAALADIAEGAGAIIWLVGSPKDAAIGEEICAATRARRVHNLCGRTSLADAVDLLATAAIVVSNDSGLMHVAAALDRPLIALYGSSSPEFTPPLSADATIVRLGLGCSPCFERECPLGHLRCLTEIAPERVWSEIRARSIAGLTA
jgi:heptosyltransferase-2